MVTIHKRILIIAVAIPVFFAQPLRLKAQEPLIPVNTNFSYWDHHWIMWITQHPVYETIEVMSTDNPDRPESRLIRVFLTERANGKKQVHYFSDASVAGNWRGEAYYRNIEYRTEGMPGKPMNLYIKFNDKNNALIEWVVRFEGGQELSKEWAGLRGQGGHAADTVFLIFYKGPNATTTDSNLLIDGNDYSSQVDDRRGGRHYYKAVYSLHAYTAVVSYGESNFIVNPGELRNSLGRVFKQVARSESGTLYRSNLFGFQNGNYIEVETNAQGEMRAYRHYHREHSFKIEFEPALLSLRASESRQSIRYKISIDAYKDLVEGVLSVRVEQGLVQLEWQHQKPDWMKDYSYRSTIRSGKNGYSLIVARKK